MLASTTINVLSIKYWKSYSMWMFIVIGNRSLLNIDLIYLIENVRWSNNLLTILMADHNFFFFNFIRNTSECLCLYQYRSIDGWMTGYSNNLSCNQWGISIMPKWQHAWKKRGDRRRCSFFLTINSFYYDIGVGFFLSIFSTWRSIDNNTINSVVWSRVREEREKKKCEFDCIYRRDETGLWKIAMSLCWLWAWPRRTCFFYVHYLPIYFYEQCCAWLATV